MPITAHLTAACRGAYPNIRYRIVSLSAESIISHLDEFELDLGLTYLDEQGIDGFESLPLFEKDTCSSQVLTSGSRRS